jgi:prophage DNA circulation protein
MSEAITAEQVLNTITAAASSMKSVVEAIKTARTKAKGNKEAMAALLEAQELALSLQASLFAAKEQAFALQEENRELRTKVRQYEERAIDQEKYEPRKVGQATVMVLKDSPDTFLCATCFANGKLSYLEPQSSVLTILGTHHCSGCGAYVTLR